MRGLAEDVRLGSRADVPPRAGYDSLAVDSGHGRAGTSPALLFCKSLEGDRSLSIADDAMVPSPVSGDSQMAAKTLNEGELACLIQS